MAKVTVPAINVGDEIKVSTLNDFIASANAVPGSINAENVMNEGIDRRNLALKSIQETNTTGTYYYLAGYNNHEVPASSGFGNLVSTTGDSPIIGPFNCLNNEWILVNCSFMLFAPPPVTKADSYNGNHEARFILEATDMTASTVSKIGGTERRFNHFMVMEDSPDGFHAGLRYSCTIVAAFKTETTSSGTNQIRIALKGRDMYSNLLNLTNADCKVREIKLFARVLKK
jgi:hypothetical protein